jgi:phosphotransferase system enzyme I (PtsI)
MAKQTITGLGVSSGARLGRAFRYAPVRLDEVAEMRAAEGAQEAELSLLQAAKDRCTAELTELVGQAKEKLGEGKEAILKGQISILNDPAFYPLVVKQVQAGWSAATAVRKVTEQTASLFENMKNAYMQERAADVRDVGTRLVRHVLGRQGGQLSDIDREVILVADDLAPSDTVQLDRRLVAGFITRIGGKTSHTAIMANSLGIPPD